MSEALARIWLNFMGLRQASRLFWAPDRRHLYEHWDMLKQRWPTPEAFSTEEAAR